jgi:hypothetical protein
MIVLSSVAYDHVRTTAARNFRAIEERLAAEFGHAQKRNAPKRRALQFD